MEDGGLSPVSLGPGPKSYGPFGILPAISSRMAWDAASWRGPVLRDMVATQAHCYLIMTLVNLVYTSYLRIFVAVMPYL